MHPARALLLFLAAASAAEALHAGAVPLQSTPHAVLPGYQIVLPFPAGGASPNTQFSAAPSPFEDALYPSLPRAFHAYSTASTVHPFATPLIDNYVETDAYGVQSPITRSQHTLSSAAAYFAHGDDLAEFGRVAAHYQNPGIAFQNGVHTQASPSPLSRSRSFQNTPRAQSPTELAEQRFQPQHSVHRQYTVPQITSADFRSTAYQPGHPDVSDRRFQQTQPTLHDYRARQYPQQQLIELQPSSRVDETFSRIPDVFGSQSFPYVEANDRTSLLVPESRHRIQVERYNIQRTNALRNRDGQSVPSSYLQPNALSLPLSHNIQGMSHSNQALQPRSPVQAAQPAPLLQQAAYRVDVEGNSYGYRYAVESSHNPQVPVRRGENIVSITPPPHVQ